MRRRVAVSSIGTRLCLLYLLEGWLASRLALAAANGNLLAQTTPLGLETFSKINVRDGSLAELACPKKQFIYVTEATWASSWIVCRKTYDATDSVKKVCEDKQACMFFPVSRPNRVPTTVYMGDPCPHFQKTLKVRIECRDPCNTKPSCGNGKCFATTSNSYICSCNPGYINSFDIKSLLCIRNLCVPNPCGHGKCELNSGNTNYTCHCPPGEKLDSGTCKAYDTCKDSPSPCPKGANCSDGYGKLPKCTCPEFHKKKKKRCVAIDTCDSLECPPEADCVDGVGKQGTCQCQNLHEYRHGKCEPVDQCLINNGGCDPKATCTDGVGKPVTCNCPQGHKLNGEECIFDDLCLRDNGGCHQNASCEHKEGEKVKCRCKQGYAGDGHACDREGFSFIFPENGTIKMILHHAEGKIFYNLGRCLSVVVDPKTNHYIVTSTDRAPQTTGFNRQSEAMEGGEFTITLHLKRDVMQVFIEASPKGATQRGPPKTIERPWDNSCEIEYVTVQDDRGPGTEVEYLLTTNIFARRSFVVDT